MARPERKNADYFPYLAKDGRTLFILEGKYRCKGTGFFTNVLRFLTRQDDHHFCIADETDQMYFMSKCHCEEEPGIEMLEIMVKTGKLDKELWDNHKIIACQDLLDSLKDAYRKRTNDIITMDEIRVNAGVRGVSGGRNSLKGGDNPQSKVKKSKEKETKLKGAGLVIKYLNEKTEKNFSDTSFILARLNEGKTIEQCLKIIDNQITDQYFIENPKHLNPQTLFRPKHWDKYLNNIHPPTTGKAGLLQPTTYAQAQDAERRDRAKWIKEQNDGQQPGAEEGHLIRVDGT